MPGKGNRSRAEVLIIGAGASGLFCAQAAARRGLEVLVLEAGPRACRKLRASGGGRCNLTHLGATAADYFSDNPHFCKSALARFGPEQAVRFFEERGLAFEDKEPGRLFCAQGAGAVARVLEEECARSGVRVLLDCAVWAAEGHGPFLLRTRRGEFEAGKLVLATAARPGPSSGPRTSPSPWPGSGSGRARAPGPRWCRWSWRARGRALPDLAGISLPARVCCAGRQFEGGLLFTHRGLSVRPCSTPPASGGRGRP
jgi:predicted Rossmann fold flavoprotein